MSLDQVFGTEMRFYKSIFDTITIPNGTNKYPAGWDPSEATWGMLREVRVFPMTSDKTPKISATCTRNVRDGTNCKCEPRFEKDDHGECIQCPRGTFLYTFGHTGYCVTPDREEISCDQKSDWGDMGFPMLKCPADTTIAVNTATVGRTDTEICSGNKDSSPLSNYAICTEDNPTFCDPSGEFIRTFRKTFRAHCAGKTFCSYRFDAVFLEGTNLLEKIWPPK